MAALTIPEAMALAVEHHKAGRLQEAERLYNAILAAAPGHADARHLLGHIDLDLRQVDGGLRVLRMQAAQRQRDRVEVVDDLVAVEPGAQDGPDPRREVPVPAAPDSASAGPVARKVPAPAAARGSSRPTS